VFDRDRDIFFSGSELLIGLESADEMIPICEAATPSPGQFSPFNGRSWAFESYEATWYNHVIPPNSALPYCTTFGADTLKNHTGGAWRGIFEASSLHSGTVNLLLLDGSVRTISNSISLSIWQAMGTKSGGD
jgi:prepilin-type processing-associated H-X9-DG protein